MPNKGVGVAVGVIDVFHHGLNQVWNAVEGTLPDSLLGNLTEPPFHQVERRGGGWRKVQVDTQALAKPCRDLRLGMGGIAVHDEVQV